MYCSLNEKRIFFFSKILLSELFLEFKESLIYAIVESKISLGVFSLDAWEPLIFWCLYIQICDI